MATIALDYDCEHKKEVKRFAVNEYLLLGPGPLNVSDRVLRALSFQCMLPISSDFFKVMDEVKSMLQYVFQTKNRLTIVNQCSGNGGNETVLLNLLDPGDKIVVAIGGTWGELMVDMAKRHNVFSLRKPPGEVFSDEELEEAVVSHKADLLFVTHGESTGGTIQKLDNLGFMCHKHNCLLAVDAVVSIAVEPLFVDRWQIDAVSSASQKAIGAPPGMALLTFSERAETRMNGKKIPPPYYFDVKRLGQFWKCFDTPRIYHYTFSSNLVCALREALAEICEEGLEKSWQRHQNNTKLFWKHMEELGLESFVKKIENRFMGVTCVKVPPGIDQMEFLNYIKTKYAILISPGLGPTLGKAIRVGFLGQNSKLELVEYLGQALKDALEHFRHLPYNHSNTTYLDLENL